MTTGGGTSIPTIISSEEKTFLIIPIGDEALGGMNIGGGIEKLENYMIKSINLLKEISDGGMGFLIIKTCLLTIWIYLLPGYDITRISPDFGEETERLLIG